MTTTRPTVRPTRLLLTAVLALLVPFWVAAADKLPPKYPFPMPPLELIGELSKADPKVTRPKGDELALLRKVWEQRVAGKPAVLTPAQQTDLFLIAGGVTDPAERKKYRRLVDELVSGCEERLTGIDDPAERGQVIERYVHEALPNGYKEDQTSISAAFDTQEFNCVSASALVYLVGTHYGLDLRPMVSSGDEEGAGHAYLEWVPAGGGKRVVVENTTPAGFGWLPHADWMELCWNRRMLVLYSRGRETDAAGLAGSIFANRVCPVLKGGSPDYPTAVRLCLSDLTVDPDNAVMATFLVQVLDEWGMDAAKNAEWEKARVVLSTALACGSKSPRTRELCRAAWVIHIAVASDTGGDRAVAAAVKEAARAMPEEEAFATPTAFYAYFASLMAKQGEWEIGQEVFARGLRAVPAGEREWLLGKRAEFFAQWSAKLVDAGDFNGSLAVLAAADLWSNDPALIAAVRYHATAAARTRLAATHLRKLYERFPELAVAALADPTPDEPAPVKLAKAR